MHRFSTVPLWCNFIDGGTWKPEYPQKNIDLCQDLVYNFN